MCVHARVRACVSLYIFVCMCFDNVCICMHVCEIVHLCVLRVCMFVYHMIMYVCVCVCVCASGYEAWYGNIFIYQSFIAGSVVDVLTSPCMCECVRVCVCVCVYIC